MEITRLLLNTKTFEENLKRLNCNNCSTFVFFIRKHYSTPAFVKFDRYF